MVLHEKPCVSLPTYSHPTNRKARARVHTKDPQENPPTLVLVSFRTIQVKADYKNSV